MKAQYEAEVTLDRVSTREELCEVFDLLNDTAGATSTKRSSRKRYAEKHSISADPAYEFEKDRDVSEDPEEVDELSVKLASLFADESEGLGWIN